MKYIKSSLIECECCEKLRSLCDLVKMGDMPLVYICKKCLEEMDGE